MSANHNSAVVEEFILSIDVGTTNVRSHLYNRQAELVGEACEAIEVINGERGSSEISPDSLWSSVVN
ncbi:putative glycerol kinase 5-like protein, partial [Leptotrombidium deliense]